MVSSGHDMLRRKRKLSAHSVLENLKEEDLRSLCGEAVLKRGFDYYRQKRVLHPIIDNDHMHADVAGSSYEPYRVEIRAKDNNIKDLSISCTCPYEDGVCKHAIALLYTWI
ncbi:MAG: SWIM zinc finger family protein, partial [Candidatus Bathyarchaeia archaeon]